MSLTKVTYSMIKGAPVNVLDFGAVGDGTTDDTAAIQAAINKCAAGTHTKDGLVLGQALYIPAGTFVVTQLNITSPIAIIGAGSAASRLYQKNSTNLDMVVVTSVDHIDISGICFDGNRANQPFNNGNGLFLDECLNVVITDCEFRYCSGNGMRSFGGAYLTFDQCTFRNNFANGTYHTTTAVAISDGTFYIRGSNSVAYENGYDGFCYDPGSAECTLTNCVSHENGGTGFNVFGNTSGIQPFDISFSNCISRLNDLEGFSCHSAINVLYTGCQSILDGQINTGLRINGFIIENDMAGQAKQVNVTVVGCTVVSPNGHGIYIDSVTADKVTNVIIADCYITNVGNNASNTYDGIYVDNAQNVDIMNVRIFDSQSPQKMRYGVTTTVDAVGVKILGGDIGSGLSGQFNVNTTTYINSNEADQAYIQTPLLSYDKGLRIGGNPRPRVILDNGLGLKVRLYQRDDSFSKSGVTNNLYWTGTGSVWNLDDTAKVGWDFYLNCDDNTAGIKNGVSGANPTTLTDLWHIDGSTVTSGKTVMWLVVNTGSSTVLKNVQMGANDSGGTGFRLLRVEN
jgi:hypothetical protein